MARFIVVVIILHTVRVLQPVQEQLRPFVLWTRKAKGFTLKGRKAIPDISDRELYTILAEISRTKGHHITVILDCCHSSGVTRHPQGEEKLQRHVKALSASTSIADMFAAADKRLGELKSDSGSEPRYQPISKGDWTPEIPVLTHVVLAACNAYEYAAEG